MGKINFNITRIIKIKNIKMDDFQAWYKQ